MDQKQFDKIPLAVQVAAHKLILSLLLQWLAAFLATSESQTRSQTLLAMKRKLDAARAESGLVTFPELSPELSDALAGEHQDAFDEIARTVEKTLGIPQS